VIIDIEDAQNRRKEKRREIASAVKARKKQLRKLEKKARPKMSAGKKAMVLCAIVGALTLFGFNGFRNYELVADRVRAEKLYEEKLAEKARLELELSKVNDPEYIEQQARERFQMLKDGEILYVFPQEQADNSQ